MPRYEGGTANTRIEWVEESTEGTVPSDPSWNGFSYNIENYWNLEPDAGTTALRGVGSVKPNGHFNGAETHEASFEYSLARWFTDNSGNAQDPSYYALDVSSDNDVQSTLSVVSRMDMSGGGVDSGGRRTYIVGKGGHPGSVTLPFETEEGTPILVSLEMQFEKARAYQIDQPNDSTALTVSSTSDNDTTQTLTVEDEGAATSTTFDLNGTTDVTDTTEFTDIDAAELDAEAEGDVTIEDDSGNVLLTIYGQNSYPADEGDLGVPALGSGSHASSISEGSEVVFLGDTIDYDGTAIADEIESGELTVDLGLDDNTQTGTARRNIHITEWDAELTASLAGTDVTESQFVDYLTEVENDVKWTSTTGSTITLSNGRLRSPGEFAPETSQAKVMLDATFGFEDITIGNGPA